MYVCVVSALCIRKEARGTCVCVHVTDRLIATMSEYFSLSDCDVIGFDLDHTLCRYHLKETSRVSVTVCVHAGCSSCKLARATSITVIMVTARRVTITMTVRVVDDDGYVGAHDSQITPHCV